MADDTIDLDEVLADAHLPSLAAALVHLTGDASLVARDHWPVYDFFGDSKLGGYTEAWQAELRGRAKAAIQAHLAGQPLPPSPDAATLRQMMDFVAGAEIPEHYAPFLMEELQIEGYDTKRPDWTSPKLKAAAAKLPVVIVGAGMSGLLAGIRLQEAGIPFTIVEKNAEVGGTWFENSYPDCRVDNPSHLYSYSFEPNHEWPNHFSPQPVLLAYFKGVADKHGLRKHIRFETQVEEAAFDEASGAWRVRVKDKAGKLETLVAKAVISAVGQLNQPRYPDLPGREDFAGPSFHSARWDHDVDLKGKRVAVIGTGASAFQFVPQVAKEAAQLTVFQRTPPWLAPTPDYHQPTTAAERWLLEHAPFYEKWYRFWLFWMLTDGIYEAVKADPTWNGGPGAVSPANAMMREMITMAISAQATDAPDLLAQIMPVLPDRRQAHPARRRAVARGAEAAERDPGHRAHRAHHPDRDRDEGRRRAGVRRDHLWHRLHRQPVPAHLQGDRPRRARTARGMGGRCARLPGHDRAQFPQFLHDLRPQHQHRGQRLDHLLLGSARSATSSAA